MKNMLKNIGAMALLTLSCQSVTANELTELNLELEALKETVLAREAQLETSEITLKAQSETLRCLSKLLEAYNTCESQHTLRSQEHRLCLSTANDSHPECAS